MSKRTIMIAVLVVILFGAALFSCVLDFKKKEPEPDIVDSEDTEKNKPDNQDVNETAEEIHAKTDIKAENV